MVSRGTAKPYVHFLGNSSVDVTGSCHLVRFRKYAAIRLWPDSTGRYCNGI